MKFTAHDLTEADVVALLAQFVQYVAHSLKRRYRWQLRASSYGPD